MVSDPHFSQVPSLSFFGKSSIAGSQQKIAHLYLLRVEEGKMAKRISRPSENPLAVTFFVLH